MATMLRSAVLRTAAFSPRQCRRHMPATFCAAADTSGGGAEGGVAPPDVRQLARMAQMEVTDHEVSEWAPKIESIVQWFGQLQQADLEGVPPAVRADVDGGNFLRPDEPREFANRPELLAQVPEKEGAFVKVPKIVTGGDS